MTNAAIPKRRGITLTQQIFIGLAIGLAVVEETCYDNKVSSFSLNNGYVQELSGVSSGELRHLRAAAKEEFPGMVQNGSLRIYPAFSLVSKYTIAFRERGQNGEYPHQMTSRVMKRAGLTETSHHLMSF
jgi:hypothetical protein